MHAKKDLNRENVENSATLKLRRTYQGREWDWTSDSQKLTERWVGTQDLCLEGLQENRPRKGNRERNYFAIKSLSRQCDFLDTGNCI